jgi:post-segregation antitoxin (ccd killing protein)
MIKGAPHWTKPKHQSVNGQKVTASLYLDYKIISKCRMLGINMSQICNRALMEALNKSELR